MNTIFKDKTKIPWIVMAILFCISETAIVATRTSTVYRCVETAVNLCVFFLAGCVVYYGIRTVGKAIWEHKINSLVVLACILFMIYTVAEGFSDQTISSIFGKFALFAQIFLITAVLLGLFGIYVWKWKPWQIYLLIGTMAGLVMMLEIPIGGVPDEIEHICSSYQVSDIMLGIHSTPPEIVFRADDLQLARDNFGYSMYGSVDAFELYLTQLLAPLSNGTLSTLSIDSVSQVGPYILSGAGITLGRLLGLGTYLTLMIGRLFNFTFYMLLTTYAVYKIPQGKLAMMVILLMPMSIQQGMSYSYDSLINGMTMVLIAETVSLAVCDNIKSLSKWEFVIMAVFSIIMFPLKSKAYMLICFMPWIVLLLKKYPLSDKAKKYAKWTLLVLIIVFIAAYIIWGLTGAKNYQYTPNKLDFNETLTVPIDGYSISYFIAHPFDIFTVFANTFANYTKFYYITFVGMYLGWLNIELPLEIAKIYIPMFIFSAIKRKEDHITIPSSLKKVFAAVILLTTAFIFAGMLFSWSPITDGMIQGIQGRYFIPIAVPFLLLFITDKVQISNKYDSFFEVMLLMLIVYSCEYLIIRL